MKYRWLKRSNSLKFHQGMSGRSQGEHRQNHIENSRAQLSSNSYILFPHWDLETGRKMQSVPPTVFSGFSSAVHLVYLTSLVFLFFVFLFFLLLQTSKEQRCGVILFRSHLSPFSSSVPDIYFSWGYLWHFVNIPRDSEKKWYIFLISMLKIVLAKSQCLSALLVPLLANPFYSLPVCICTYGFL